MLKGSNVLVTGGSGFIGSHLMNRLKDMGCRRIVNFDKSRGVDITSLMDIRYVMEDIDYVFHMAVLPLGECITNPRLCVDVNIFGTLNVLEAAVSYAVKKIVFSSASSVYGDTEQTMDESCSINPKTTYGISKFLSEYLHSFYYNKNKLDYVILRYMNVYGSGQKGGLIPAVLKSIKENKSPIIDGDGLQSFDFVHVDDVVEVNILAMESDVTNEIFNIGGENEVSVKDVVGMLLEFTKSKLKPIYKADVKLATHRRVGSSAKAHKSLGYSPKVSIEDGLKRICSSI